MKQSSRIAWLIIGTLLVAGMIAFVFYYRYQRGSDDPPGVIFERSDRPARV